MTDGNLNRNMIVTEKQILEALKKVIDPDLKRDIVSLGFIQNIRICEGKIAFKLELTTPACPVKDILKQQCEDLVLSLQGVDEVFVELTSKVPNRQIQKEDLIPDVKQCIAIASGKGGVGKSTLTVNLAIALAQTGARVGLLDADVYGPSIPLMMGCEDEQPSTANHKIVPISCYGIQLMSLGFLLEDGQAVLWRGPMVAGTVRQLLADVDWGYLDYLLVDLPPGTGDAPMTLAQLVPLTGVVIVTTPHHIAANIAGKSAALFRRLNAPILGVVENMTEFICPHCQETSRIFAGTPGTNLSTILDVPFLGSIPLDPSISLSSNNGVPSIVAYPNSDQAQSFHKIAGKIASEASIQTFENLQVLAT